MTDDKRASNKRALSSDQRRDIVRALSRRDSQFLDECCQVLGERSDERPLIYSELYQSLATKTSSKIAVLNRVLTHFGYHTLSPDAGAKALAEERYDIAHLIDYAEDNPQRFVSMMIDFAAQRSPSVDEALHLEHLLDSGQVDRRSLIDELVLRYPDTMAIEEGDIVLLPPSQSGHTLCQTWRKRLIIHPDAVVEPMVEANLRENESVFKAAAGPVLAATFDLSSGEEWRLSYALETSGEHPVELVVGLANCDEALVRVTSSRSLTGRHDFTVRGAARKVQVSLSCLQGPRERDMEIAPSIIRLEPCL